MGINDDEIPHIVLSAAFEKRLDYIFAQIYVKIPFGGERLLKSGLKWSIVDV